jgi:hypothetical protein
VSERFSVFTSEEAQIIVTYLEHKLDLDILDMERDQVKQALANYWFAIAQKNFL